MDYDKEISRLQDQKKKLQQELEQKKQRIDLQVNYLKRKKLDQERIELNKKKLIKGS